MEQYKIFENVSYDSTADAMYIKLNNEKIFTTEEVKPNIIVDKTKNNKIVGIEILEVKNNSKVIKKLLFSQTPVAQCVSASAITRFKDAKKEILT